MKTVYQLTESGWVRIYRAQSFSAACAVARAMQDITPGSYFCVNT